MPESTAHPAGVDAELEWRRNGALSIGPRAVSISPDGAHATLHDLGTLEDLRETRNWDPMFTLRSADDSTCDVAVGRPADDGTFALVDVDTVSALEAAAVFEEGPDGLLPEPEPIAATTRWLHDHEFKTCEHSRAGKLCGSRLFEREDGRRVRYSCAFGTWALALSPPAHHPFYSFRHFRPARTPPGVTPGLGEMVDPIIGRFAAGHQALLVDLQGHLSAFS